MSRVALIGNSHLAAFKDAEPALRAAHPGIDLDFYGVENPVFFARGRGPAGALRVAPAGPGGGLAYVGPTGAVPLDLSRYDRILLCAHGFYLQALFEVMAAVDVLDLAPAGRERSISLPLLAAAMAARAKSYTRRLTRFFPCDARFAVVQMPYPAEAATAALPDLAGAVAQPDAARLLACFEDAVATAVSDVGLTLIPVPEESRTAPFLTRDAFARAADLPPGQAPGPGDLTHMNASYAKLVFAAAMARPVPA